MLAAQIILALCVLGALTYTVLAYPNKYGALSGRSRLFRTAGLFLLDVLLVLVLMYTFIDFNAGVTPRVGLLRLVFYVASCLFLCFALVCVSLLDALESYSAVRRERRNYLESVIQAEQEAQREAAAKKAGKTGGTDGKGG